MDSDAFIRYIGEWESFYLAAATASATLVGLLFVGISLNVDEVMAPDRPDLRALAEQAFASFTYVLLVSLFFLIPRQDPISLGIELATLGIIGLARVTLSLARSRTAPRDHRWGRAWIARRMLLPGVAYAGLTIVGYGVTQLQPDALTTLVAVLFVLLTSAADSSWDLLVRVSDDKRRRAALLAAAAQGDARVVATQASEPLAAAAEEVEPLASLDEEAPSPALADDDPA